jgi:hypothetical protein
MTAPTPGARVAAQVQRGLTARLLAHQLRAQLAHITAIAALVVVLWDRAPHRVLVLWAAGVMGATLARAGLTRWARRREPGFKRLRRGMRVLMALIGLTWGLGAAALVPYVHEADALLVLAVLATLAAGGGATLVADPVALGVYSICLLVPLGGAMIALAPDRLDVMGGALIVPFTAFTILTSREAYRDLTARLQAAAVLEEALANVRTLSGLLPICASCKKIRNDRGYWSQIEEYVREHSDADFTHGICPDCARRLYGDLAPQV